MKLTNFNVKYAVLFAVLGAMLYGAVINGQMVAFLNRLLPPSERPLSDQIIHIEPEQQEEEFYLPASGHLSSYILSWRTLCIQHHNP